MPPRVSAADAPEDSARRTAVAGLAGVGAGLLGVKAAFAVGSAPYDAVEPLAGSFVALVAGAALAAGLSTIRAPELARALLVVALGGAVFGDFLVTAAPRHLYLLPLAIATGLMFVDPAAAEHGRWSRADVLGWLGVGLHAAVGSLYLLVSKLFAPAYGVLLLWALWGILLVVALRLLRDRPSRTPVVPVVAAGLWLTIIGLGGAVLGWTV